MNAGRSVADVGQAQLSRRSLLGWAALGGGVLATGGLTACSSSSSGGGASSSGGAASGTIKYLANDGQTDAIKSVFAAYKKAEPGVTVNATFAPSATYGSILNTQLQSGNGPDSFACAPGLSGGGGSAIQALAKQGVLADLSDQPWAKAFPDSLRPITDYEGKTYGLFTSAGAIPAYYNKAVLQGAGVDESALPTTWTEFLALCQKLKDKGIAPITQGLKDGWPSILIPYALTSTLVYGPDPEWEKKHMDGKVTFEGSGWEQSFELYKELNDKGYLSKASNSNTFTQMATDVATGKAAMCIPVSQALPVMMTVAKPEDISSFATPANDDASSTHIPFGLAFGMVLNAKSSSSSQVKNLLDFWSQPEQVALMSTGGGNLPPTVTDSTKLEPSLQPMLTFISKGLTSPYPDPLWPSQKVQDAQIKQTQLMLSGSASPKDVAKAMDAAYAQGA